MKSNAFGLDIGTTSLKVVWLDQEKNVYRYLSSLTAFTPSPGIQSESPFDHQEMAKLINKLVIDAKITTNNVNIALPENHVFTKVIDMPVLSEKELSSAIRWEAEQYIPASLDTMRLDWNILRTPQEATPDQKMQVLLVAAPIALIKKYQTILELAGLSVTSIETEILSTIRGVVGTSRFPTSLLMNIGALSTSLAIVQNGIIVFNYSIPLGGMAMTRAIAADFGLNLAQAEEYKKTYGLSDKNFGGKVKQAISPIQSAMMTEVKKAMTFYAEKYKNESPISQVLLTGGGANLPGIAVYFAQDIGLETVIANPWKQLNVQAVPRDVDMRGPEYTVAVGLAIKEYEE
jgi:type IV pilus assembly protein PilM